MNVKIEQSWKERLHDEFSKDYFVKLAEFVKKEYSERAVYPAPKNVFRAFDLVPFDKVEVVIVGQDPYHGEGQANGLSFAVNAGVRVPPSLRNIFKELNSDVGGSTSNMVKNGDLTPWAEQGVLLLNATLTVRAATAGSHQGKGWEQFTDAVLRALNDGREHLVFILWGNYAKQKGAFLDRTKHLVLTSAHPSPFSATAFFGNRHFSKTNEYLRGHGEKPIDW